MVDGVHPGKISSVNHGRIYLSLFTQIKIVVPQNMSHFFAYIQPNFHNIIWYIKLLLG